MAENTKIPKFVKWAGGKTQLIEQYKQFFPGRIDMYFEPFVGSGAVFFYLKKNGVIRNAVLSDTNSELINAFRVIRDSPEKLIGLLRKHKSEHNKPYFYKMRSHDPETLSRAERAARFIYLNKTCFNGLYRVNSKGKFNVPIGSYKNPSIFSEPDIMEASELLKGVTLRTQSFEKISPLVNEKSFIYFDPPYLPLSKTSSFTSYTKDSFSFREQEKLAHFFNRMNKRGSSLMLSNSNTNFIIALYKDYNTQLVSANRMINCDAKKRGAIKELLVRNNNNISPLNTKAS